MKYLFFLSFVLFFSSYSLQAQIGFEQIQLNQDSYHGINNPFTADLDGDGDLDFIGDGAESFLFSWRENLDGLGNYGPPQIIYDVPFSNLALAESADFDGDGDIDIVFFRSNVGIFFENIDGLGNFENHPIVIDLPDPTVQSISVGDFDNDGDLDILFGADDSCLTTLGWLVNDGAGNFDTITLIDNIFPDSCDETPPLVVDVDNDGDLDVVLTLLISNAYVTISWYRNLGDGTYSSSIDIETHFKISIPIITIHGADIDGDGDTDLVFGLVGEFNVGNYMRWIENDNGLWLPSEILFFENATNGSQLISGINTGDFDNDGDLDIIYNFDKRTSWRENLDGLGSFGEKNSTEEIESSYRTRPIVTDYNGDGALDFIVRESTNYYFAFKNIGQIGNQISGTINLDYDGDGCEITAVPIENVLATTYNGNNSFSTFTNDAGEYSFVTNAGNFTTTIVNPSVEVYGVTPEFHTSDFPEVNGVDIADFCLNVLQEINDLNIVVYPLNGARPGFEARYQIYYRNVGNTTLNGTISLQFNEDKLNFESSSEPISSQSSGNITFDYNNLLPFQTSYINVTFLVEPPPNTEIDDVLTFTAEINPIVGDTSEEDNTHIMDQIVVGSYDPNDIIVLEGEEIFIEEADEYLHYIIRFQNTGTADAINVHVTNRLDEDLDWSTLQIQTMSHSNRVDIFDGDRIDFIFDAINLPDSTTNEEESHGFITYRIKPKSTVVIGDVFTNRAHIFFDFNPPVITNTVTTTIVEELLISENSLNGLKIFPNPTNGLLNIQSNTLIVSVDVINQLGQLVISVNNSEGIIQINIQELQQGMYFIKLKNIQGTSAIKRLVKE